MKNAPSVTKMHEDRIPEALIQEFPSLKGQPMKFNNGLIGMSKNNIKIFFRYLKLYSFIQKSYFS